MTTAPQVTTTQIECGSFELTVSRPADSESLIDEERFEGDEFLPYWAELWPSGLALARYVARRNLTGACVLELGCGLGLPSLAAAHVGARVVATDWAPEALDFLERNAAANSIHLETALVVWADEKARSLGTFEVVLAADVLYEERNATPLLQLLDAVVADTGEVWLADPGRRHAGRFFELAGLAGWACEETPADEVPRGGITCLRRQNSRETG